MTAKPAQEEYGVRDVPAKCREPARQGRQNAATPGQRASLSEEDRTGLTGRHAFDFTAQHSLLWRGTCTTIGRVTPSAMTVPHRIGHGVRCASSCRRRRSCRSCRSAKPPRLPSRSWASRRSLSPVRPGRPSGIGRLVRARRGGPGRVRPCHRHRELGAVHSRGLRRARPTGVRRASRQSCGGGGTGRALPSGRARLRGRRTVRRQRRRDGDCGVATHGIRQTRRLRDGAGRCPDRVVLGPRAHRPGLRVRHDRQEACGSASASWRSRRVGASSPGAWRPFRLRRSGSLLLCRSPSRARPAHRYSCCAYLVGLALALPAVGGGEALARAAHELPPPRVQALRRMALLLLLFTFLVTAARHVPVRAARAGGRTGSLGKCSAGGAGAASGGAVVDARSGRRWPGRRCVAAARSGRARRAGGCRAVPPASVGRGHAVGATRSLHARFGTPARALDVTAAAAIILVILVSGGRVTWLARAYAMSIAATLVAQDCGASSGFDVCVPRRHSLSRAPLNLRLGARDIPLGLLASGPAARGERAGHAGRRRRAVHRDAGARRKCSSCCSQAWAAAPAPPAAARGD